MADLTKSLLKAISIIADKSIEEVSSDKTIRGTIKKVVSTSEGKYLINYNSGDFYAYVQSDSNDLYQTGEQVYILIPAGDMSQKKFIIGRSEDDREEKSKSLKSSLLNDYVALSDSAVIENEYHSKDQIYVQRMQPLSLNPFSPNDFYYCYLHDPGVVEGLRDKDGQYIYNTLYYPSININEEVFSNAAKQAEALLIRAKFKASPDTNNIGNYGIIVNIAFEDRTNPQIDDNGNIVYPPKLIAYVLDTNKMTGNPARFYDYTSQYIIANFDGENYLYIDSIVAFSEGFTDQAIDGDEENYIYIDGLEITALTEASAADGDYKLKITAPQGNTVKLGSKDSIKIVAEMTYLNKDITKNTIFYWGVKDPSVTSISPDYNAKFGSGYRYIKTGVDNLILSPADLTAAENIYICAGVYESDIILKTTISLYNNNNRLNITIDSDQGTSFQFNEGDPVLTCLINGKTSNYQDNYPDEAFTFIWTKEDSEFGSILLDTTEGRLDQDKKQELDECAKNGVSNAGRTITQVLSYYSTRAAQLKDISYPAGVHGPKLKCKLKNTNSFVTYSCAIYRAGIYVGYGSIILQNSKSVVNDNYYITITNGSQVFQYDEIGIAPNSQRKQNPIEVLDLTAVFHSPQGAEVTPKKVRWLMPEGKTLINIPSLGLETDAVTGRKCFNGVTFPLSIKDTYDNTYSDNQITVIVTHMNGTEYRQTTSLLFTKIGETGTNGTDTVVKINELIRAPEDECLTIIKEKNNVIYNTGDSINATPALEASVYINNNQALGYTTSWSIAGSSKDQGLNYKVENDEDACKIYYKGLESELDTRIVKAEVDLNGKYLYNFYGMPAIEYEDGYNYEEYPIKIMRDGTLRNVLYTSNGTNPEYNQNQGVHIELPEWINHTGYIDWHVESGPQREGRYVAPNFSLAASSKSKVGSEELVAKTSVSDIQAAIFNIQDVGENCKNNTSSVIKAYIENFLADIEKIAVDTLLSTSTKIVALQKRLEAFNDKKNNPDNENVYIKTVYQEYLSLLNQIKKEYEFCKDVNREATKVYDQVQGIWRSEWPSAITEEKLSTTSFSGITNIQQLINRYQAAYDNRSNEGAANIPNRFDVKDSDGNISTHSVFEKNSQFLNILGNSENYNQGLDKYYADYVESLGLDSLGQNDILVEYSKVLMAYLNLFVQESQECFNGNYTFINGEKTVNLFQELKNRYKFAYSDWDIKTPAGCAAIGKNIYDTLVAANGEAAAVYDNIRALYKYYQSLYVNVNKYQIAEESETLKIWAAILNGQVPSLLNQIYVIPNETFNGLYMNNNVVGDIFIRENNTKKIVATVYVPIIMTLNTYELPTLNGWDGTSVEVGDDHILTPQVGAGIKDSKTNTFTGMVMGVIGNTGSDSSTNRKTNKVGLVGYSNGRQSVFIDSETGKASFGLPEQDSITEQNTSEGRIELNPGGVSKIGNWKIGNRFLYNVVDGSYERRKDNDTRSGLSKDRLMVPHDKHGIILSADQPYIHIKGQTYGDTNLNGINYEDEYNNINPGDSLELRMDPQDKSLFSVVQHTAGFGDEDIGDLHFGYKASSSDKGITIVKNYVANQNTDEQVQMGPGAEYYVYRLATEKTDNNKEEYIPYYEEKQVTSFSKVNGNSWKSFENIYSGEVSLIDSLTADNFKKMTGDTPVFTIDSATGSITYNPNNLVWTNEAVGFSNDKGWQSITGETFAEEFSAVFKYSEDIDIPITKNIQIGQIRNGTAYTIYKMKILNCTLHRELIGLNLNDPANSYIQFYIVPNQTDEIEKAILVSDTVSIWNDQDNVDIELSANNEGLHTNTTYYLNARIFVNSYTVDADCSCEIEKKVTETYKAPPVPPYGTVEITETMTKDLVTSGGSTGKISVNCNISTSGSNKRIWFTVSGSQMDNSNELIHIPDTDNTVYDFILWKRNSIIGYGRTLFSNSTNTARKDKRTSFFFNTTTETTPNENSGYYKNVSGTPSAADPWYISFYPEGFCITEKTAYTNQTTAGSSSENTTGVEISMVTWTIDKNGNVTETTSTSIEGNKDSVTGTSTATTIITTTYRAIDMTSSLESRNLYEEINWKTWSSNNQRALWSLKLKDLSFGGLTVFIPKDIKKLCVRQDNGEIDLQGILYAKTFWENNEKQKVTFYKEYYDWNYKSSKPYGYIDVAVDNNIHYKYIKTLANKTVNAWFDMVLPEGWSKGEKKGSVYSWIEASVDNSTFVNALNWKEFIRIGIDENGRFFSSGRQDKKTYSRTGKIYSFGKVPDLYGQEIRVQVRSNSYTPIIKTFAQTGDNTAYITQGQNDDGNISIRTAGNNKWVELAASQLSSNSTNSIPEVAHQIKVGYNVGVEIKSNNGKNIISLTNKDQLIAEAATISIVSKNSEEVPRVRYSLTDDGCAWIQASSYVVSSIAARNGKNALTASLASSKNIDNGHYRIKATSDNSIPVIQLQVGKNNVGLDINSSRVMLKSDSSHAIEINAGIDTKSYFNAGRMRLEFDTGNQIATLKNNRSYIQIVPENDTTDRHSITLYSNLGGKIDISDGIKIKGRKELSVENNAVFQKKLYAKSKVYATQDLHIGYSDDDKQSRTGLLYLYHDDNAKNYVKVSARALRQLFDWYNQSRWMIGCYGNTVFMRSVAGNSNPEGGYVESKSQYQWTINKFSGYVSDADSKNHWK